MKATLHLNPFTGDTYGSYGASTPATFTPTTMKSLAQLLDGQEGGHLGSSFLDAKRPLSNTYCGGSAVVVVKEENPYDLPAYPDVVTKDELGSDDPEYDRSDDDYRPVRGRAVRMSRGGTKRATASGTPSRGVKRRGNVKNDYDGLSPGDREKLFQRRERNKQAAARCRQRREDLTQSLLDQVKAGDAARDALEREIVELRSEKKRLEKLLREHEAGCSLRGAIKMEPGTAPLVRHRRPASLSLPPTTYSPPTGVAVETPSNGLSFDNFLSSNSGFTPLLALNSPPTFGPTCSVQQRSCEGADLTTPGESASLVSL